MKPTLEMPFPDEPFALAVQSATDGDRIVKEKNQRAADRQHAAQWQTEFPQSQIGNRKS